MGIRCYPVKEEEERNSHGRRSRELNLDESSSRDSNWIITLVIPSQQIAKLSGFLAPWASYQSDDNRLTECMKKLRLMVISWKAKALWTTSSNVIYNLSHGLKKERNLRFEPITATARGENNSYRVRREVPFLWRNRFFREIRRIYLFSSRAIYRRARGAERRARKNSPDGHKAPIVVPGGPLYLRQEPAGSCEHAPRMNRGISVFLLSTNTSRLEYPNGDTFRDGVREGGGEGQKTREKDLSPGTWPSYQDWRETSRHPRETSDAVAIKILAAKGQESLSFYSSFRYSSIFLSNCCANWNIVRIISPWYRFDLCLQIEITNRYLPYFSDFIFLYIFTSSLYLFPLVCMYIRSQTSL